MTLERTSILLQKRAIKMKMQGMSISKTALSLRACRKTISKIYARDDQGLSPECPKVYNEKFKDMDWNRVVLAAIRHDVPIKTLWQEAKDKQGLDVNYKTFWREFRKHLHAPSR